MTREVPLSRGLVALVDDADFERVTELGKWYADLNAKTYYARKNYMRGGRSWSVKMHAFITGWEYVDHVNGDGLDNRRVNLRRATDSQNAMNRGMRSDNTTGFKGVHRRRGRFVAEITVRGKRIYLGEFPSAIEAAMAYDSAALANFGAFARPNFSKESA